MTNEVEIRIRDVDTPFTLQLYVENAEGHWKYLKCFMRLTKEKTFTHKFLWWSWESKEIVFTETTEGFFHRCVEEAKSLKPNYNNCLMKIEDLFIHPLSNGAFHLWTG